MSSYLTNNSECPVKRCDLGNEFYVWYDSIAGIRFITSSLSVLGAASIVWMSLISRRLRSSEVHPIFMISLADLFLSLLYIVGSGLWIFDNPYDSVDSGVNGTNPTNGLCLYLSFFSTWMHLASTNMTVLYAFFAFLGLRKTLLDIQGIRYRNYTRWITLISYIIAWLQPVVVTVPVFVITVISTGLVDISNRCGCWCKPTAINGLPWLWLQNTKQHSPYVEKLFDYTTGMYWILIVNFSVSLLLLLLFYGLVMWYLKKLKDIGGALYRENDRNLPVKSSSAKLRMYTFLMIFIITGLVNFILVCDSVEFVNEESSHPGSHVNNAKHREFAVLLLLQSLTVSLQGFLNAIVYGWTRQDFVVELKFGAQSVSADTTSVRPRRNSYQSLPTDPRSRAGSTAVNDKDFAQFSHSSSNKFI
ncbi:transmembrane protein 116-like [Dysidea avara]|uniref:transmembrane protein 116-like n=1 Tax=Dysidea avara TaxID=196820 RepID=UPI003330E915